MKFYLPHKILSSCIILDSQGQFENANNLYRKIPEPDLDVTVEKLRVMSDIVRSKIFHGFTLSDDLMLVGMMALPFVGIFLWTLLGERFWDRVIARFAIVRFVLEWAFAVFFLEFGILMLAATRTDTVDHILSR